MLLEKFLLNDGVSIEEKFKTLSQEQHIELLNEINQKRESLKESKIVAETKIKTLEESKIKLLNTLKEKYNLNSIEEAEIRMSELNDEIISVLTTFAEEYQSQ